MLESTTDHVHGEPFMYYCTSEPKYLRRLRKLLEEYPGDIEVKFDDGQTLDVKLPASWFREPRPPRKVNMTEEQRQAAAERLRKTNAEKQIPAN